MRDIVVLLIVYGALPFVPFRPFLGLCLFSWLAYMRPQDLSWTLGAHKLSQVTMMVTVAGLLAHVLFPKTLGTEKLLRRHPVTFLLIAMGAWTALTAWTAIDPALSRAGGFDYMNFEKTLFLALLTLGLVGTLTRFRLLLSVIAFSLGLLGFKYGLFGILRGGAQIVDGPGGFMIGRNSFAVALNMAIPLLVAIGTTEDWKPVRIAALSMIPFCALAIIFTFSRGGLLTLAAVGFILILRSGRPTLAALALVAALGGFSFVSTDAFREQYLGRVSTIGNVQEDDSAMGRVREWRKALRIARDYPLFGVGPNNIRVVYARYRIEDAETPLAGLTKGNYLVSHNSYLQILIDSGVPGLGFLLTLITITLWKLEKLRGHLYPVRIRGWANGMQIAIIAWMLGGMLLNMAYFDLLYHLFALTACLAILARSETSEQPRLALVEDGAGPWWKRPDAA